MIFDGAEVENYFVGATVYQLRTATAHLVFMRVESVHQIPPMRVGRTRVANQVHLSSGLLGDSKALLQQVRGDRKSVPLGDSLLDRARIVAIERVVKHVIDQRR